MSVDLDIRKWCTIIKLEGYTTPSSADALVEKFHEVVEALENEGVEIDVFMLLEDKKDYESVDKPVPRKPDRLSDG